jgi:Lrp/AsnC family leucine-responsive transcriptional regulator
MQLDPQDLAILRLLQEDALLTNREIGTRIFKSHSSVNDRIQRLKERGFIKKYTVVLDNEKLNLGFMTFTSVQLKEHNEEALSNFEREILKIAEVLECHQMAGKYDFVLRIVARDHRQYHETVMKKLFSTPGVLHVETQLVLKTAKMETLLPIV